MLHAFTTQANSYFRISKIGNELSEDSSPHHFLSNFPMLAASCRITNWELFENVDERRSSFVGPRSH